MNFPVPLQIFWRGKRLNSFNRVFKNLFQSRVYKIGLRMDFTRPNRDGKSAVVGLEAMLRWVNRGHSMKDFLNAMEHTPKRNLRLYTRLIFSFPDETHEDILATASLLNNLRIDGIKRHDLHVINAVLEPFYRMDKCCP